MSAGGPSPLAGRDAEVVRLRAALDRVEGGTAQVVELLGEPGIGKSRLLSELAKEAELRDHLVLRARSTEFEREVPFALLVEALDDHLADLGTARLSQLSAEHAAQLAGIFPSMRAAFPEQATADQPAERYRAHRAVRDLIERLTADRPLLLVFDDVHWADVASVELISHLLRRPPDAPVLIALAHRTGQLARPMIAALGTAIRDGFVDFMNLAPLDREAAELVIGPAIDRRAADAVFDESGGNPFYLEELARAALREQSTDGPPVAATYAARLSVGPVPPLVIAALFDELAVLTPAARATIEAGAVAGDSFDPATVAAATDLDQATVLAAIDELVKLRLIVETDMPHRFSCRHPLVRRTIYVETHAGRRFAMHEKISNHLRDLGASASTRAHHVEQAAHPGDTAAIAVLREAAAEAAEHAPSSAARWLENVLRLLPERDDDARLEVLVPLASAHGAAGNLEASRLALLEAIELLPADDVVQRARLITRCATLEQWLGHTDRARERLEAALAELPDRTSRDGVAILLVALATDLLYGMRFAEGGVHGADALELATAIGDPALEGAAAAIVSLTASTAGWERADPARALARERLDALTDDQLADHLDALFYLGWAEIYSLELDHAMGHFQRGQAISRSRSGGRLMVPLMLGQSEVLAVRGELAASTAMTDAAVDAARISPNPQDLVWALWAHTWTTYLAGRLDDALRAGAEAAALSDRVGPHIFYFIDPSWQYGLVLVERGEHGRGAEMMRAAMDRLGLESVMPQDRSLVCNMMVRAEVADGDLVAADEWAARGEEVAARLNLEWTTLHARRGRAATLMAQDRPAEAVPLAREAKELAERTGSRLEAARAQLLTGRALAAAGEHEEAIIELRAAESALRAYGSEHWRGEAERNLRRLGQRVNARSSRPSGDAGLASLTGREREVADLVAAQHTNREIAGLLFLSEKTIETHLRSVFVKLGVSSRSAVARTVTESAAEAEAGAL